MRKLVITLALVVVVGVSWRALGPARDGDNRLLFGRMWIDQLPFAPTDFVKTFVVNGRRPFGAFVERSQWKGTWEGFRYQRSGDGELDLVFPQARQREHVRVRASACNERGFDFCLDVEGASRGVKRYYSRKGWEVRDVDTSADLDAHVAELFAAFPAEPPAN
jgi:hypothetical protein